MIGNELVDEVGRAKYYLNGAHGDFLDSRIKEATAKMQKAQDSLNAVLGTVLMCHVIGESEQQSIEDFLVEVLASVSGMNAAASKRSNVDFFINSKDAMEGIEWLIRQLPKHDFIMFPYKHQQRLRERMGLTS